MRDFTRFTLCHRQIFAAHRSPGYVRRAGASAAIYAMTIDQCKWPTLQHVSCSAANASTSDLHIISLTQKSSATLFCFPTRSNSSFFLSYRLAGWNQRLIFSFSRKVWSIVKRLAILGNFLLANDGGKIMIHLIWYILVGLIAGVIAKSVMHVHMTIFWTIVLGIIGSIIGGAVTHMFSRPTNERYHPAGLIFSTLGAILVLFICYKLKIHFPQVNPF